MQKISIILPVKDTALYLRECIDSILSQTYSHWELLAVDDGSSDDSFVILQEYAQQDPRIKAFKNPSPSLLKALRFGYVKSNGEWIHRMDSDDRMPEDKLEVMMTTISTAISATISTALDVRLGNDGERNVVVTGATEYFSDEGPIGDGFKRYDQWLMQVAENQSYRKEVYKECVIPSNCWLVHRNDFDRIGAFKPETFPEDYDLCFRFIAGGLKIVGLPKVLHHWRDRPDRISRNWDVYKDNRFFALKVNYFFKMDRDETRPLVLWGAGKNGKDLVKHLIEKEPNLQWVCDNEKKIGKDIYGIKMHHYHWIKILNSPQIIISVASPDGQIEIEQELREMKLVKGEDYWFFS